MTRTLRAEIILHRLEDDGFVKGLTGRQRQYILANIESQITCAIEYQDTEVVMDAAGLG